MKCQDFHEIIDSYLCDELLTETNHEVLRHLEACSNCRSVIESRRILRAKLKSAVKHSPQFQMSDVFYNRLHAQLKQSAIAVESPKNVFWMNRNSWMAFAATVIFAVGLGFWVFQSQPKQFSSTEADLINDEKMQNAVLADFAVGDHQNCAIEYNLTEKAVEIDLKSAQFADLRQSVLTPLENAAEHYEFLESHTCKFAGHDFTHIVFKHEDKIVSVLLTDLQNYPTLKTSEIAKISSNGYQVARFDVKDKAVFVISDLPEKENLTMAEILKTPMENKFSAAGKNPFTLFALAK